MSDVDGLAEVVSRALTDADEWVKSAEVENIVEAILSSPWLAARVQAARAEALEEAADAVQDCRENGLPDGYDSHPYAEGFEAWLRARAAALRVDDAGGEGL